eukprot:COSAG01_NODE_35857_length_525_cov_3.931925_1_plen_66_part_01
MLAVQPARAFLPSVFPDQNRGDVRRSQSKMDTASRMETPGAQPAGVAAVAPHPLPAALQHLLPHLC